MVRIDMCEYQEKHTVSRLVGAPPGLRRLRRGRPAHRGRPPPPLRGGAARRDREGPPRRVQRPAAGARRRPADRRPGPHRRLHQRRAHHDVEPRRGEPSMPRYHFKPEFLNRIDEIVISADSTSTTRRDRRPAGGDCSRTASPSGTSRSSSPRRPRRARPSSATTRTSGPRPLRRVIQQRGRRPDRARPARRRYHDGDVVVVDARATASWLPRRRRA